MLVRPSRTNFKMTVTANYYFYMYPPPFPYKSSCFLMVQGGEKGGIGLWTGLCPTPPSPLPALHPDSHLWLPASKIKQTFLSTSLDSLLAFEQ